MALETAYKRVGIQEFDHKEERKKLQSSTGTRAPQHISKLLDEEDMIDEREMKKATNRLMRRDYEDLVDEENDGLFKDPLDRYDEIILEAPSAYENDQRYLSYLKFYSIDHSSNLEDKGLLQSQGSRLESMHKSNHNLMPKEEIKGMDSDNSDEDGIKFINNQDKKVLRPRTAIDKNSELERDEMLEELKKYKGKLNKVLMKKDDILKSEIEKYDEKFVKEADQEIMDVGAMNLEDLETDFGMIEDERERKKKQRDLEYEHRKKGIGLTAATTQNKLVNTHTVLLKDIAQEEIEARKKAVEREKIIKKEFQRIEKRVSGVVKEQRNKILSYFGPLVQDKKRSAYTILGSAKKKVDLSARTKI